MATGQYAYQPASRLEYQAGEAWVTLTQREKTCYVSGVLVGCMYLAWTYDQNEKPDVRLDDYYEHLYATPNTDIVKALDLLYGLEKYWKMPIIVLVFEHRRILKELGYGN